MEEANKPTPLLFWSKDTEAYGTESLPIVSFTSGRESVERTRETETITTSVYHVVAASVLLDPEDEPTDYLLLHNSCISKIDRKTDKEEMTNVANLCPYLFPSVEEAQAAAEYHYENTVWPPRA